MKPRTHTLLNLALLLATAGIGTWWVLQLTAARPPAATVQAIPAQYPVPRSQPVDMTPVARLFGADAAAPTASRVRLTGVIAEGGRGAGIALLAVEGEPAAVVRAGETVGGTGSVLVEVRADHAMLRSPGGTETVRLPALPAPAGLQVEER